MSLLPNVLAKQAAREQGAKEAWFVDAEGFVTEGSSSNAWIVTRDGAVVTRPADFGILRGITRTVVLEVIAEQGLKLEERAVHDGRGLRGARGVHHLGDQFRDAGGADRWPAGRQWRAGTRSPARCGGITTATLKSPELVRTGPFRPFCACAGSRPAI